MQFYSTNNPALRVGLREAVSKGLAADKGLFMPAQIPALPPSFFDALPRLSLPEMALEVARPYFTGPDLTEAQLAEIVADALDFPIPLVPLKGSDFYSLELFHGPTCAFKDVGGRFMARLLAHLVAGHSREITVLVATSGDTGSAVASGFFQVPGIQVVLLYPKGKVSFIQEQQLTTYGHNITALEVDGTFDDCQAMVKEAFLDPALTQHLTLTSANSINVARFLPQSFYYFHAWGQLATQMGARKVVFSVPSGNFGNLTAGLFAQRMGLPVQRFIAATNTNDVVPEYLTTSEFRPRPSVQTIANAMDVGNPSNFARMTDLFAHDWRAMSADITGFSQRDEAIRQTLLSAYHQFGYVCDPHGAIGLAALQEKMPKDAVGIFLETAHPAKFADVVEEVLPVQVDIPQQLARLLAKQKQAVSVGASFAALRDFLLSR